MSEFGTLIEAQDLASWLECVQIVVVDCRYSLDDPDAGRQAYEAGHIPSAVYAHLDKDLSGVPVTDCGRHPLPSADAMIALFGRLGVAENMPVVAYDEGTGAAAARLWWMLRYMGHDRVSVLNGGLPAWSSAGYPLVSGIEVNEPVAFLGRPRPELLVQVKDIDGGQFLVDSRAPERFRGEVEPIDPVAGHIPGAVNYFHQLNIAEDGRYLPASLLHRRFTELLGDVSAEQAIFYCGSGVTACNNLLAMAYGGLGDGRLYVGSWSEWCRDPDNPVAVGG